MKGTKFILTKEFVEEAVRIHLSGWLAGGLKASRVEGIEVDRYGVATVTLK